MAVYAVEYSKMVPTRLIERQFVIDRAINGADGRCRETVVLL